MPLFKLYWVVASLIVVLAGVLSVTIAISSAQAMPLSSLFSNPNGSPCEQPCMLGLQPGVTEFNIADERLQAHPFLQGRFKRYADRTSRDLVEYVTTNLRIVITKDGRKLASISLDFDPRLIRRA